VLAVAVEAGYQIVVTVLVHRVVDRCGGVAANEFFNFFQQLKRFPLFKAHKELFITGDQFFQAILKYEQVFSNSHKSLRKTVVFQVSEL
jgi:hypothetical protein